MLKFLCLSFPQTYKMDASPCGLCLIINNVEFEQHSDLKDRKGSDIDSDKLERRFRSLNFDVVVKRNLKYKVTQGCCTVCHNAIVV